MGKPIPGLPIATGVVRDPDDMVRTFKRLQPALRLISRAVDFGPVPGAYFPFTFCVDAIEGTIVAETTLTTSLTGTETQVVVSRIPAGTAISGTIKIELDSGTLRTQAYNTYSGTTFTINSANYNNPNDAGSGNAVFIPQAHLADSMLADTGVDGQPSIVEFRPIAVAVWCDTGEVTIDLNADGTSILDSAISTSSSKATKRARGDFAVDKVDEGSLLTLDIDTIDSGAPTKLRVTLWASQLGKIEDV